MLLSSVILRGTRAAQPAAGTVPAGTLYCVTDESGIVERSTGAAWQSYSPSAAGTGTVTNTGTLTADRLIIGNGGVDVEALGSAGTTTTVLHGNAAGAPTFGAVALATDVSGDLPFANLTQIAGVSVLGVAGSATADVAAITAATDNHVLTRVSSTSLAFAMPAMVKIEELTPTGTNATFSSLGAFTHLRIVYSARGDAVATSVNVNLTFNADGGSNYDRENLIASAATASGAETVGSTSGAIAAISAASAPAGACGTGEIVIPDYRGTTFRKGAHCTCRRVLADSTTNILTNVFGVQWRSTAAITSIELTLSSGNFASGSKVTLYGMN